ncbi:unnamed protein product [Effrenium voratum]|nr:unnamed protein product [Effrenium voratum]
MADTLKAKEKWPCKQCYVPCDGWYCEVCEVSTCDDCGRWTQGMKLKDADGHWICWNCDSAPRCIQCRGEEKDLRCWGIERLCHSCYTSTCDSCGDWEGRGGMRKLASAQWRCRGCSQMSDELRSTWSSKLRALDQALTHSFDVWDRDGPSVPPVPQPAELLPWLLIGAMDDTWQWLQGCLDRGIAGALVLCGPELEKRKQLEEARALAAQRGRLEICYALDNPRYAITCRDEGTPLSVALEMATWAKSEKKRILINCLKGVNRAAAICAAVMMEVEGMTLLEACKVLAQNRGRVLTNISFRKQLLQSEGRGVKRPRPNT